MKSLFSFFLSDQSVKEKNTIMAEECETLTRAFSGFGVDEKSIITILAKWHPEQRNSFRKEKTRFFTGDDRHFERWEDSHIAILEREFARFQKAVVLWTMHPWERDARLVKDALSQGSHSYNIIIEIACTRSSEELLGARRAYHSLYDHSIEEDVAYHANTFNRKLLVALVSSYRYEGPKVNESVAKSEAKSLGEILSKDIDDEKPATENDEIVRILATRSKAHLTLVFKLYKEIHGKNIDEDLEAYSTLKETVQCLSSPKTYFSKVLNMALDVDADEITKEALTRVIVTRADEDMKEIKEEYYNQHAFHLFDCIAESTHGNFKDFLLTLVSKQE